VHAPSRSRSCSALRATAGQTLEECANEGGQTADKGDDGRCGGQQLTRCELGRLARLLSRRRSLLRTRLEGYPGSRMAGWHELQWASSRVCLICPFLVVARRSESVDTALCTITRSQPAEHSSGQAPTFLGLIMMALRFRARAAGTLKENAAAGGESRTPFQRPFAWARARGPGSQPLMPGPGQGSRWQAAPSRIASQHARQRGAGDVRARRARGAPPGPASAPRATGMLRPTSSCGPASGLGRAPRSAT
jgi:hypothetical protein